MQIIVGNVPSAFNQTNDADAEVILPQGHQPMWFQYSSPIIDAMVLDHCYNTP